METIPIPVVEDFFILPLPEDLTEDSVIRIGSLEAPIRLFIRYGLVTNKGGRLYRIPGSNPQASIPVRPPEGPDPCSLAGLEARGFAVIPGKKTSEDKVFIGQNISMRISEAVKHGVITADTPSPKTNI
jgi:hypothetical protein